jgi:hypothetical protein
MFHIAFGVHPYSVTPYAFRFIYNFDPRGYVSRDGWAGADIAVAFFVQSTGIWASPSTSYSLIEVHHPPSQLPTVRILASVNRLQYLPDDPCLKFFPERETKWHHLPLLIALFLLLICLLETIIQKPEVFARLGSAARSDHFRWLISIFIHDGRGNVTEL